MAAHYSAANAMFEQIASVCPATHSNDSEIITVVWDQRQIGKRYTEQADGSIKKESAVTICQGIARQFYVPDHETFKKVLELVSQSKHAAIINTGFNPVAVGESFYFLSRRKLKEMGLDDEAVKTVDGLPAFARLKIHKDNTRLMQVMDRINAMWGRGTLRSAAEGIEKGWKMKREKISPGYTTCWEQVPIVG